MALEKSAHDHKEPECDHSVTFNVIVGTGGAVFIDCKKAISPLLPFPVLMQAVSTCGPV